MQNAGGSGEALASQGSLSNPTAVEGSSMSHSAPMHPTPSAGTIDDALDDFGAYSYFPAQQHSMLSLTHSSSAFCCESYEGMSNVQTPDALEPRPRPESPQPLQSTSCGHEVAVATSTRFGGEERREENKKEGHSPLEHAVDSKAGEDVLSSHGKHLFIFTSAGKPVFSRYGDENALSSIFGLLQVLMSVHCGGGSHAASNHSSAPQEHLHEATVCLPGRHNSGARAAESITFHFFRGGEMRYVLATRGSECAAYCNAQLRRVHAYMLTVVPTISTILAKTPGYDVRRLYSSADFDVLRGLIKKHSHEPAYFLGSVKAAVLLAAERRHWLEALLLKYFRKAHVSACVAPTQAHLFSYLFFRGSLVALVGPREVLAGCTTADGGTGSGAHAATCGLHPEDVLLLIHFASSVMERQQGQAWAPLCLPHFNNTGYLWCHCCSLSELAREQLGTGLSPSSGAEGMLLVQLSASQDDFEGLSTGAAAMTTEIAMGAGARLEALERALEEGARLTAAEVLATIAGSSDGTGAARNADANLLSSASPLRTLARNNTPPQWFSMVIAGCTDSSSNSALRHSRTRRQVQSVVCTAPSSAMMSGPTTEKRILRDLAGLVYKLRALPHAPSSVPLIVESREDWAAVVLSPTEALMTLLCDEFYNSTVGEVVKGGGDGTTAGKVPPPLPYRTVSSLSTDCQSVVQEVVALFLPGTPPAVMLYWATRMMHTAVLGRARLFPEMQLAGRVA